jgi:hypothetical protein
MGKRLPKNELLAEIPRERRALDDTLAHFSARTMSKAGVTRGGWSIKDILAHLVEWQQMNLDWYAAGQRGVQPAHYLWARTRIRRWTRARGKAQRRAGR